MKPPESISPIPDPKEAELRLNLVDTVKRFRLCLSSPDEYAEKYQEEISERLSKIHAPDSDKAILFSVYSAKGLFWAIDQFSRQNMGNEKLTIIVFQNGKALGSEVQAKVQKFCETVGVRYEHREEGLGAWGARSYAMLNLEKEFAVHPELLYTFDEDTGPISPEFISKSAEVFKSKPDAGALYSPPIFLTQGSLMEQLQLLAYKSVAIAVQMGKVFRGKYHTTGPNAVFRAAAVANTTNERILSKEKTEGYNGLREDDFADLLLETGYTLEHSFTDINLLSLTSGDTQKNFGIWRYLGLMTKMRLNRSGSGNDYGQIYQRKSKN